MHLNELIDYFGFPFLRVEGSHASLRSDYFDNELYIYLIQVGREEEIPLDLARSYAELTD